MEKREFRSLRELRAEKTEDGKRYLAGYAANYNVLSEDIGWGIRERIMPGAFTRALKENQDIRHLINHDANLVLGRTKAGTTEIAEDSKGLRFRTEIADTTFANDLFQSVVRGDIDECSFGFVPVRTEWLEEPDPDNKNAVRLIRELLDVDLFDISTVTFPAYPETNTTAERYLADMPTEFRAKLRKTHRADPIDDCLCQCAECIAGDCEECSDEACADENCRCQEMRSKPPTRTKRIDGENLPADSFLIGNPEEPRTWKLPFKFSTEEKTKTHLQNNIARFNQLRIAEEFKTPAWSKLVGLCKAASINVSEASGLRSFLTTDQIYDFEKDSILALADAILSQHKSIL